MNNSNNIRVAPTMMMFNPTAYSYNVNISNNDVDSNNISNKKQKISMNYPSMDPNRMGSSL